MISQVGASLGIFIEMVMSKQDEFLDYVRIRVGVDVTKEIMRGSFIRLSDGSRRWISFAYERMPLYCCLCGFVGHMEKKCPSRFADDFVDPGQDFPSGEWLKAVPRGVGAGRVRLSLQPIPTPVSRVASANPKGEQVFGFGGGNRGKEKILSGANRGGLELGLSTLGESSISSGVRKRKMVLPSASKNRRLRNGENNCDFDSRPSKVAQIGGSEEFVDIPVVAAMQPHRSQ